MPTGLPGFGRSFRLSHLGVAARLPVWLTGPLYTARGDPSAALAGWHTAACLAIFGHFAGISAGDGNDHA